MKGMNVNQCMTTNEGVKLKKGRLHAAFLSCLPFSLPEFDINGKRKHQHHHIKSYKSRGYHIL